MKYLFAGLFYLWAHSAFSRDIFSFVEKAPPAAAVSVPTTSAAKRPEPILPVLQGIVHQDGTSIAFIDNEAVYIGQRIAEFTLTQIDQTGITLTLGSRRLRINLDPN